MKIKQIIVRLYQKLCSLKVFPTTSQAVIFIDNYTRRPYSKRFIRWRLFLHAHTVFVVVRLMIFSWLMYHYGQTREQIIWTRYLQYDPSMAIVLGMKSILSFDSLTGLIFALIIVVHLAFDYVLYFHFHYFQTRIKRCDLQLWRLIFDLLIKNGNLSFKREGWKSFQDWLHSDSLSLCAFPSVLVQLWKCRRVKLVKQFSAWPHLIPNIRTILVLFNKGFENFCQFSSILLGLFSPFFYLFNLVRIIVAGYTPLMTIFGSVDITLSILEVNIFLHNTFIIFHFCASVFFVYGAQCVYLNRFLAKLAQFLKRKKCFSDFKIRAKLSYFFEAHSFAVLFQLWLNSSIYMHVLFILIFNLCPISVYFISILYMRNLSSLELVTYSIATVISLFILTLTLQLLVTLAMWLASPYRSIVRLLVGLSERTNRSLLRDRLKLLSYYSRLSCHEAIKFRLEPVGVVKQQSLAEVCTLYQTHSIANYIT